MPLEESNRASVSTDNSFPFTMFTITEKQCVPPGPGFHYLHWHEDLQFTLVTKGNVLLQVDGADYRLAAGDSIFINSGFLHMTSEITRGGEYLSFNFPSRFLSFFPGSGPEQDYVLPFTGNYRFPARRFDGSGGFGQELSARLYSLAELCRSNVYGKSYEIAVKTAELWLFMIREIHGSLPKDGQLRIHSQQKLQSMLSFIHQNYAGDITLSEIASAAHVSAGDCCRTFKKVLHVTPYRYLLWYRIQKSADLLRETGDSVAKIAGMTGFNDSSHFIQCFKRQLGQTPLKYRRQFH